MKPFRDKEGWFNYTPPKPFTWRRAFMISLFTNVLWAVAFYLLYKWMTRGS